MKIKNVRNNDRRNALVKALAAALLALTATACGVEGDYATLSDGEEVTLRGDDLVVAPGATETLTLTTQFDVVEGFNLTEREVRAVPAQTPVDDTDLDVVFQLFCRGVNQLALRSSVSVCSRGPVNMAVGAIDTSDAATSDCAWSDVLQTNLGAEPSMLLLRDDESGDTVAAILEATEVSTITLTFATEAGD